MIARAPSSRLASAGARSFWPICRAHWRSIAISARSLITNVASTSLQMPANDRSREKSALVKSPLWRNCSSRTPASMRMVAASIVDSFFAANAAVSRIGYMGGKGPGSAKPHSRCGEAQLPLQYFFILGEIKFVQIHLIFCRLKIERYVKQFANAGLPRVEEALPEPGGT